MVAVKQKFSHLPDGNVDIDVWLQHITEKHTLPNIDLIKRAALIAKTASQGLTTFYGQPCLEQGLEMAEILLDMKMNQDAVAASILTSSVNDTHLTVEMIKEKLSEPIAKLINGVKQTNVINTLQVNTNKTRDVTQIDRLRKTFLAMVSDIRVVVIKLAERICIMRGIKNINFDERKRLAQETLDIYAPLANRLGIGQIKWELEDLAFHYTDPLTYKKIATFLSERRVDREKRIHEVIELLKNEFSESNIKAAISGRAKHIYSIFLKSQKKQLDYQSIFDYSALRILVPTLDDCYTALSIINSLWNHIPEEFDDYIAYPKPNGYRSIHAAVIDTTGKNLEIQIRTYDMHEEAEHGVSAHWVYKEDKTQHGGYESKITFLRQLLSWHKELAQHDAAPDKKFQEMFEDRIYVFTPENEIIDLPKGATPLDFAYHIHSGLGHRCRGAKIDGHIVPLTYVLRTGDRVEIITTQHGTPSRDWLKKDAGYITTARARAKIAHFFREQDIGQYIETGKHALEREFSRAGIQQIDIQKIVSLFNFKNADALFSSIGHGNIKAAQIVHTLQRETHPETETIPTVETYAKTAPTKKTYFQINGIDDLLTRVAKCCKPIPGDTVIGYITQGRGVSIHRKDCNNMSHLTPEHDSRLIEVNWDNKYLGAYFVDLQIRSHARDGLLKEVTALFANAKVDLVAMNSTINKKNNTLFIVMTVQIHDIKELQKLIQHISQMDMVYDVKRVSE